MTTLDPFDIILQEELLAQKRRAALAMLIAMFLQYRPDRYIRPSDSQIDQFQQELMNGLHQIGSIFPGPEHFALTRVVWFVCDANPMGSDLISYFHSYLLHMSDSDYKYYAAQHSIPIYVCD